MKRLTIVEKALLCLKIQLRELIGTGVRPAQTGDRNRCCEGNVQGGQRALKNEIFPNV